MSYKCEICGKKTIHGRAQQHQRGIAGKRWKKRAQSTLRTFKPNLQWVNYYVGGVRKRIRLCTKCLRKFKKERSSQVLVNSALG